ncbi:MAG: hypothetical protein E7189_06540 [Erysipelotrichaceae bacterium]|nr:hypothetical protein [Erysipelotrichaceae bacterium]
MKGTLKNGFEFDIPDNRLDNMELVDALSEVEDNNPLAITKVANLMLGKEQKKKLYDYLRTGKGNVPIQEATQSLIEIMSFKKEGKN